MNKKKTIMIIICILVLISVIGAGGVYLVELNRQEAYIPAEQIITRSDVEKKIDFYVVEYNSFDDVIYYEREIEISENEKEIFEKVARYLKENHPNKKIVYVSRKYQINLSNYKYSFKQILDGYVVESSYFSVESRHGYYTKVDQDFLFIEKACQQPNITIEQVRASTIDYLYKNSEICDNKMKVKIHKCIYDGKESWGIENNNSLTIFQLIIDAKTGRELYSYKADAELIV